MNDEEFNLRKFIMKYENKRDPELMEFMKDIFKKFQANELTEEELENLIYTTFEENLRRNYPHLKRTVN